MAGDAARAPAVASITTGLLWLSLPLGSVAFAQDRTSGPDAAPRAALSRFGATAPGDAGPSAPEGGHPGGPPSSRTGIVAPSVAREWTEALLFAFRHDRARPPVHARTFHHLSVAMYDAWAVGAPAASPFLVGSDVHPACALDEALVRDHREAVRTDPVAAVERAVAQAAWRFLRRRYVRAADAASIRDRLDRQARSAGLNEGSADAPAVLGARVAACVIGAGRRDDANEDDDYRNLDYTPVNPPLDLAVGGNDALLAPSRWQPLAIPGFRDQAGRRASPTEFVGADWGVVRPFALTENDASTVVRGGRARRVYHDPGPPPSLEGDPETFLANLALVAAWSSHLDPRAAATIDTAPRGRSGALGADDLETDPVARLAHYDPAGGQRTRIDSVLDADEPVRSTRVALGDYARVVAEYWADGPDSETPPGHWLRLYNEEVASHPDLVHRLGGADASATVASGTDAAVGPLVFDLVAYLAIGGAMHDAAIAAWSVKGAYDSVRPISAMRYLAEPRALPGRPDGAGGGVTLPTVAGLIEPVRIGDPLAGPGGMDAGQVKVRTWRGPRTIRDPARDVAGVGWTLARDWWPYQRPSFVTPPFAGHVSGHSTFSRAAAVVLERLTGSPRWPGGEAGFVAPANAFLVFERGPSVDVPLRWATYRDAADESALSRIWGGIHVPTDDLPGRRIGAAVGEAAWRRAATLAGIATAGPTPPGHPGALDGASAAHRTEDAVGEDRRARSATDPDETGPRAGLLRGCSIGAGDGTLGLPTLLVLLTGWRVGRQGRGGGSINRSIVIARSRPASGRRSSSGHPSSST